MQQECNTLATHECNRALRFSPIESAGQWLPECKSRAGCGESARTSGGRAGGVCKVYRVGFS